MSLARHLLAALCLLAWSEPVAAAQILVDTDGSGFNDYGGGAADCDASNTIAALPGGGSGSVITLKDAICAANQTAGADDITLNVDVTLTGAEPASTNIGAGRAGLFDIDTEMTIKAGTGDTIQRGAGSGEYRILYVSPTGALTLDGVTVRNGRLQVTSSSPDHRGAGIYVDGSLVMMSSAVADRHLARERRSAPASSSRQVPLQNWSIAQSATIGSLSH